MEVHNAEYFKVDFLLKMESKKFSIYKENESLKCSCTFFNLIKIFDTKKLETLEARNKYVFKGSAFIDCNNLLLIYCTLFKCLNLEGWNQQMHTHIAARFKGFCDIEK